MPAIDNPEFKAFPQSVLELGSASHPTFQHFRVGLATLTKSREEAIELFRDDPAMMEKIHDSIVIATDLLCEAAELMTLAHQRMEVVAEDVRRLRAN